MIRPDLHLSPSFLAWLAPYLAVFSRRTRPTASALAVGALLAVGPCTVTNCLRALGLAEHPGWRGAWISTCNFNGLGSVKNAFEVRIGIVHTATNRI